MSAFFSINEKIFTAEASGRMDVMGGIADYSGSLLLQMPIAEKTKVQIQPGKNKLFRILTQTADGSERRFEWVWNIDEEDDFAAAGHKIRKEAGASWPVYILGCFVLLHKKKNLEIAGADILITTQIPLGKGVSSSAAIEVAVLRAIAKTWNISIDAMEMPLFAQEVENAIVGAACGLMDQLSVCFGMENHLLPIICQPAEVYAPVKIPAGIRFSGIDSGVRHAVGGSDYRTVRTSAFMAYSVIAHSEGAGISDIKHARENRDLSQLPFKGFLANISPSRFEQNYASILPEKIRGEEFISRYGNTPDAVTFVEPDTEYALQSCARHPVYENHRIQTFLQLLLQLNPHENPASTLVLLGELMLQSHAGYSSIGLGNKHTDHIVELVRKSGVAKQVYGARISGGGSGGTVVILSYGEEGFSAVQDIYHRCQNKYGQNLFFFSGNNDGSVSLAP